MRAVWYERNGAADVLTIGAVPDPTPGPGEVRVRMVTSGINPSDWKRRQGLTRRLEFPRVIPHQDGAGVIDQVGAGVPASRLGERVGSTRRRSVVPSAPSPNIRSNRPSAPSRAGQHQFRGRGRPWGPGDDRPSLRLGDGPVAGKTVLVTGGAGAVGHYAIQLAKLNGARVWPRSAPTTKPRSRWQPGPTPPSTTARKTPCSASGTSPPARVSTTSSRWTLPGISRSVARFCGTMVSSPFTPPVLPSAARAAAIQGQQHHRALRPGL